MKTMYSIAIVVGLFLIGSIQIVISLIMSACRAIDTKIDRFLDEVLK